MKRFHDLSDYVSRDTVQCVGKRGKVQKPLVMNMYEGFLQKRTNMDIHTSFFQNNGIFVQLDELDKLDRITNA